MHVPLDFRRLQVLNKKILLFLCIYLIIISVIPAQNTAEAAPNDGNVEDSGNAGAVEVDDPELEAYRQEQKKYFDTGFELYLHYPVSIHFPGWSYPEVDYDLYIVELQIPEPNISWGGLGAGFEIDFGSRKKVLRNMGVGSIMELSFLSSINMMDDTKLALLLNYPYLYYTTRREKGVNFSFRAGLGLGIAIDSEDLFAYPEEKDHPFGALYAIEGAVVFPLGSVRLQTGAAYRFMAINSKNIHMFTPLFRAGYRF